jgi:hypothetical protein
MRQQRAAHPQRASQRLTDVFDVLPERLGIVTESTIREQKKACLYSDLAIAPEKIEDVIPHTGSSCVQH